MIDCKTITLENTDPEDIGDVLMLLADSFGIKYSQDDFKTAKTFGDLCDVIERKVALDHKDDCTTQQAFYKIRATLEQMELTGNTVITPETELVVLFPRPARRKLVGQFQSRLGIKLDFLKIKDWLSWTILIGFILSLIALFFEWRFAIAGFTLFYLTATISGKFANELAEKTVGDLARKLMREHYIQVRRSSGTMNRTEIFSLIQEFFSERLDLDKEELTRDSILGWN